ncbi:MAG: CHAP domain-containing protein [Clostridiales bacterium]|nr:CHAP domain-containing protein [Clostridiales bacterium]
MSVWIRRSAALLCLSLFLSLPLLSAAEEQVLSPRYPVPDYVSLLLSVASDEVGYTEGDHGWSKYGEWAGDPYAQWCAEFQCWCVDQVDQRYGTALLNRVYPLYSASNTGRAWFIEAGRYVIRTGPVDGWGYQWLKGAQDYVHTGDYIPQPGDWVFFTWTAGTDTDHVALVEYCSRDENGRIFVHVIEGNKPNAVARAAYSLMDKSILGYGTVHDVMDITMRFGNTGEKVRSLQEKLIYLGYLDESLLSGHFGTGTMKAVRAFQSDHALRPSGIATRDMQLLLEQDWKEKRDHDPAIWTVIDDE